MQQTKAVIQNGRGARDDWKIIQALGINLKKNLDLQSGFAADAMYIQSILSCYNLTLRIYEIPESGLEFPSFATCAPRVHKVCGAENLFYSVRNSNLVPPFDNFYLSDVIGKSSITMGKCSARAAGGDHNFFA